MRTEVQVAKLEFVITNKLMDNPGTAAQTPTLLPVVDPQRIPPGRHTRSDPPGTSLVRFQQPLGKINKPDQIRNLGNGSQRMDTNKKAQFAPVDIPNPGEIPLIQQRQTNGSLRNRSQPPNRFAGIPIRTQKIRTEIPNGLLLTTARENPKNSELETYGLAGSSFQNRTGFECRATPPFAPCINVPEPFHLQVGMNRPPLRL